MSGLSSNREVNPARIPEDALRLASPEVLPRLLRTTKGSPSTGLQLLLEAYQFAIDVRRPKWDFSVEITELKDNGLTVNDFRWMLCKGHIEHATEPIPARASQERTCLDQLSFSSKSCFVLTDSGVHFVLGLLSDQDPMAAGTQPGEEPTASLPVWDPQRHELIFLGILIKRFRQHSPNQERVLATFQEEGWPIVIDDPLPPHLEDDPKQRLRDTVKNLNRNQENSLIRFSGNGSGEAVQWNRVPEQHG